jgi:hypothetical protein
MLEREVSSPLPHQGVQGALSPAGARGVLAFPSSKVGLRPA